MVDDDLDVLRLGVLEFPLRRLEELARLAGHHLHVRRAEAQRRPAAVHRRVAHADDQHAPADPLEVLERDGFEPVDADVDVGAALLAARQIELLALGCAAADEHRVEPAGGEQLLQALDARVVADLGAHPGDVADLLVDDGLGQPECRDVGAHQAARLVPLLEDHDLVAERQQVVGDRERRRPGADAGDTLAVLLRRHDRQAVDDRILVIRRDALQAADRHRLVLDAPAAAGRLAGPVAHTAEDAREDVRLPVDDVGVGELAQRDEADVLGHVGVCRAGPLAIDDAMEVVGVRRVGRLHDRADPVSDETVRQLSDSARGRNRLEFGMVRCSSLARAPANVKLRPPVNSDGLFCDGRHIRQAYPLIRRGVRWAHKKKGIGDRIMVEVRSLGEHG